MKKQLAKLFLVFGPLVFVMYYICYMVGEYLIAHGLRKFLLVPVSLATVGVLIIARAMFSDYLNQQKGRKESQRNKRDGLDHP
jgi:hypothetical protein